MGKKIKDERIARMTIFWKGLKEWNVMVLLESGRMR